ncbi:hypothetical protein REC12_06625 [Desulfosporosinus sp. PR]|uniref:hypothetical protein n=1 Tax=Candidatus Desulfosporosinus nitrosoreducens TaxID=3401928 RepID=UPI0027F76DFF|nr:hypothetical protein [Desulfosporosinus sp. PR]MDQ7093259.1 hypothetical protein [Desulfosporosinus sp. PR]
MKKMKLCMSTALALTLSLTLGSSAFAASLPGITSTKNIYLYSESKSIMADQLASTATSNLLSLGSLHDITIHEPTMVSNLNLPSNILVTTTEGTMLASVQWSDYAGVSINTTTQLNGKAVLPSNISNTANIKLDVTQKVNYNGSGLQSNLGAVTDNKIINIPPATTVQEFLSNLTYNGTPFDIKIYNMFIPGAINDLTGNGASLTDKMSATVVDRYNETLDYDSIVDDGDSLQISDGLYTHTYYLSTLVGTPSNSSLLLSITPPQAIAVPITGIEGNINLPTIVRMDTTNGIVNLPVQWNIPEGLSISKNVQISGTVVIPDNIYNFSGVKLPVYQDLDYKPLGISSSLGMIGNNSIMRIPEGTTVSSLINSLTNADSYSLTFKDKNSNTLGTDAAIVTGDSLVVTSGNSNYSFYLATALKDNTNKDLQR